MSEEKIGSEKEITVAVSQFPPLVMESEGKLSGFEIDLWEGIAKELGWKFAYQMRNFDDIFSALAEGTADVGLAGITINEKREKIVDFSHHTLNSGLLILTSKDSEIGIWKTAKIIIKNNYKKILLAVGGIVAFIVLFGNILWFIERSAGTFNGNYFTGVAEAFWWVVTTISTVGYGDFVPHTPLGRLIASFVIIFGYIIFVLFIAEASSLLTSRKMLADINSFSDLAGKSVATEKGTTSFEILDKIGANIVVVSKIEDAYEKLGKKEVQAVVYDAPVLLHYIKIEGAEKFKVIGDIFHHQNYGIALKERSELKEEINQTLLRFRESGRYDNMYKKWFGDYEEMEI